jgi:hypothetical protein
MRDMRSVRSRCRCRPLTAASIEQLVDERAAASSPALMALSSCSAAATASAGCRAGLVELGELAVASAGLVELGVLAPVVCFLQ